MTPTATSSTLDRLRSQWDEQVVQPEIYTSPEIHEAERQRIFARTWQFLAHESEIPEPGDYVVRYILNDSILVTRNQEGNIKAFLNTCRHRGMPVCRADGGSTSRFVCPYHGWQYDIDGRLVALPMDRPFFGPEGIDRDANGLAEISQCETWHGFVFGNLSRTSPALAEYLAPFADYLAIHTDRDPQGLEVIGEPQRWRIRANWKTGSENFAGDSYHAGYTHRSVFTIGLHPNRPHDFQASGVRNGVHIESGPGTMAFARQSAEARGYPQAMSERFRQSLPAASAAMVFGETPRWPTRGHLFPNLSFLNAGAYVAEDDLAPFLTCRVWRPLGPLETEVWSWILVERSATDAFKRSSRRAYTLTFGTTGTEEQDDIEAFHTLSRAITGDRSAELHQQLTMGDALTHEQTTLPWPGPGHAVATTMTDAGNRYFLRLWSESMWPTHQ